MRKTLRNGLPALAVLALLALALLAPARGVRAEKPLAEAAWQLYPGCTTLASGGTGAIGSYTLPVGEGIIQPLGEVANLVACSLAVAPFSSNTGVLDVVPWDPEALTPAEGEVAMRMIGFSVTAYTTDISRFDQLPPIVTRSLPTVAEPGRTQYAMRLRSFSGTAPLHVSVALSDQSGAPAARRILSDGTVTALGGSNTVAVFRACGGDEAAQSVQVMQSVVSADLTLNPNTYQYIQRFRVPVATHVSWVELAANPYFPPYASNEMQMMICDAEGQTEPAPGGFQFTLWQNRVSPYYGTRGPIWIPPWDQNPDAVLQPQHDYWLVATITRNLLLSAKILGPWTDPHFRNSIGELWHRDSWSGACTADPDRALDFRLVGTPAGTVAVPPSASPRAGFALRVWPNPAYGETSIEWAGARGGATVEVLDARGRRVVRPTSAAEAGGRWSWGCVGDDGAALPAGVYFVRARDGAGRTATARVSLVR